MKIVSLVAGPITNARVTLASPDLTPLTVVKMTEADTNVGRAPNPYEPILQRFRRTK